MSKPTKLDAPWPIRNAIGCLEEVRDRETGTDERAEAVRLGMEYAIEVVKGINTMKPPTPPSPEATAAKAVRQFTRDVGMALEELGRKLQLVGEYDDDYGDPE